MGTVKVYHSLRIASFPDRIRLLPSSIFSYLCVSTVYARRFTICTPVSTGFTVHRRTIHHLPPIRYQISHSSTISAVPVPSAPPGCIQVRIPTNQQTKGQTNKHGGWRGAAGSIYFIYSVPGQDCGINIRTGLRQVATGSGQI